jgi:hypothetical protein
MHAHLSTAEDPIGTCGTRQIKYREDSIFAGISSNTYIQSLGTSLRLPQNIRCTYYGKYMECTRLKLILSRRCWLPC